MKTNTVSFRCDDGVEVFTLIKKDWSEQWPELSMPPDYELVMEDAYCTSEHCGIKGRFRRAWKAFWAKPLTYTGIYTSKGDSIKKFFHDCIALIEEGDKHSGWLVSDDGDGAVCPHCGEDFCILVYETNDFIYCPHCGEKVICDE